MHKFLMTIKYSSASGNICSWSMNGIWQNFVKIEKFVEFEIQVIIMLLKHAQNKTKTKQNKTKQQQICMGKCSYFLEI